MSLSEIVPTLTSLTSLLRSAHQTLVDYETHSAGDEEGILVPLGYDGILGKLAMEVENQTRTAGRPFTVAVVGEFKVGKSTFLNGLLGLRGEAALSAKDTPDTACSILIRRRGEGDPEARLHFEDDPNPQDVLWARAKQLTSQVHLDKNPADIPLAHRLLEVEYFADTPVLDRVNLNDLPGTGSRYWKEHTDRTHERMKEADAVIWIVGDEEPSADARRDLQILQQCSRSVIPVLNAREDPTSDPPLERDQDLEDEVSNAVCRECRQFFDPSFKEPLRLSARVVELEQAKVAPNAQVLEEAGYNEFVDVFARHVLTPAGGQAKGRLDRLCGTSMSLALDAEGALSDIAASLTTARKRLSSNKNHKEDKLAELADLAVGLNARTRSLAKERAGEVVRLVGGQAKIFIGDVLQVSNFRDMKNVFTKKGQAKLNEELKERFLSKYLQLDRPENWLTKLARDFAGDVRDVVLPAWRRFARTMNREYEAGAISTVAQPDFDSLSNTLMQGINAVIISLLGIGGAAVLLALIPGGQVIDAVAIVGLLVLSAVSDPLEGHRRRAIERVSFQMEAQRFSIADQLAQAATDGRKVAEDELKSYVQGEVTRAGEAYQRAVNSFVAIREARERLDGLLDGIRNMQSRGAAS